MIDFKKKLNFSTFLFSKNEILFKHTLTQDDSKPRYFLNILIREICDIHCDKLLIKDPNLTPRRI